jgi:hypothetical protein
LFYLFTCLSLYHKQSGEATLVCYYLYTMTGKNYRVNWRRLVYLLPVILPVMGAAMGSVAVALLVLGQFKDGLIWPLGLIASVGAGALVYKQYPKVTLTKVSVMASAFVLIFTVFWTVVNAHYASQHVYTNRDPGVYVEAGVWLMYHEQIQIPKDSAFADIDSVTQESSGFSQSTLKQDDLYAQGTHILPAFLGLAGRLGGAELLFKAAPVLSGLALLALFSFARLVTKEKWAILAVVAFSVSLPVLYFSRDTYTEMLAAAFTFSSLTLVAMAAKANKNALWFLAGAVTGASALTRIDAFISMAGIVLAVFVYMMVAEKKNRMQSLIHALLFFVAMALVSAIGLLDVALLSSGYFRDLQHNTYLELVALAGLMCAGMAAVFVAWQTKWLQRLHAITNGWRAKWAAAFMVVVGVLLASRPLWMISRRDSQGGVRQFVESSQAAEGLPRDGLRDYAEQTVNWVAWYIGPVLTIAALGGMAYIAYKAVKSKDIRWVAAFGVIVGTALIYLNNPSITPDQIWASRRLLPVILPGIAVAGVLALAWLASKKKLWKINGRVAAWTLAALAVLGPLLVSYPFLRVRTYVPELTQIQSVCASLPKKSAVVWVGPASRIITQPTRGFCRVPTAAAVGEVLTKTTLARIAKELSVKGYRPVVGIFGDSMKDKTIENATAAVSTIVIQEYNSAFMKPPRHVIPKGIIIKMGQLASDGSVIALNEE